MGYKIDLEIRRSGLGNERLRAQTAFNHLPLERAQAVQGRAALASPPSCSCGLQVGLWFLSAMAPGGGGDEGRKPPCSSDS